MFLAFCRFLLRRARRRPRPAAAPPRHRVLPTVEALETRWVPSAIGGTVYSDLNNNGLLNPGEPGIAGNTVELHDASGALIATAVTDANGHYQFSVNPTIDTSPHTKEYDFPFPDQKTDSTQTGTVAQFDPSLGTLTAVEIINEGSLTSDIKVENLDNAPAPITGHVSGTMTLTMPGIQPLVDSPSDSEQATVAAFDGAPDLKGPSSLDFGPKTAQDSKSITLSAAAGNDLSAFIGTGNINVSEAAVATSSGTGPGNVMSMISSTSSGRVRVIYHYTPSNALQPGTYTVVQPTEPPGTVNGRQTNDNVTPLPPGSLPDTIPVTLGTKDQLNNNFGELAPASLGGFVYYDANNDGVNEPGEPGISGVPIHLLGQDSSGTWVDQTHWTGVDGSYNFTNLRPGTYTLVKDAEPPGYLKGKDTLGTPGNTQPGVVTIPNAFQGITLNQGVAGANNNFGEIKPSNVSGFVYLDNDHAGVRDQASTPVPGVTITLTGTDLNGKPVSQTQQTGPDGSYSFSNILPGNNYTLTKTPPSGYLEGTNNLGTINGVPSGTQAGDQFFIQLGMGTTGLNYNYGELLPQAPPPPQSPADTGTPGPSATPPNMGFLPAPAQNPAPVAPAAPSTPDVFFADSKRGFIGDNWMNWGW